jgi:hypothetical protein
VNVLDNLPFQIEREEQNHPSPDRSRESDMEQLPVSGMLFPESRLHIQKTHIGKGQ